MTPVLASEGKEVSPVERAEQNINYGLGIMAFSSAVTLVCVVGHFLGFTYGNLFDVTLGAIAIWRVAKHQSIAWMCIMAVDVVVTQGLQLHRGVTPNVFWAFIDYFYMRGIYGTFQHRSAMKAASVAISTQPDYKPFAGVR